MIRLVNSTHAHTLAAHSLPVVVWRRERPAPLALGQWPPTLVHTQSSSLAIYYSESVVRCAIDSGLMRLEGSRARARAAGSRITHMANQPTCVDGRITSFSDAAHANAAAQRGVRERARSHVLSLHSIMSMLQRRQRSGIANRPPQRLEFGHRAAEYNVSEMVCRHAKCDRGQWSVSSVVRSL